MTDRRRRTARALGTLAPLLLASLLAGCGGTDAPASDPPASASDVPSPTRSATPSATPTSAAPSTAPAGEPTAAGGHGPHARLLDAAELPGGTDRWSLRGTGSGSGASLGPCDKFGMDTIGALKSVERRWSGTGKGDRAVERVSRFPDETNTQRAASVLRAWHDRCVGGTTGPLRDVAVPHGTAFSYTAHRKDNPDAGVWTVGVVVSQDRIAELVVVGRTGVGRQSADAVLQAASAKLG